MGSQESFSLLKIPLSRTHYTHTHTTQIMSTVSPQIRIQKDDSIVRNIETAMEQEALDEDATTSIKKNKTSTFSSSGGGGVLSARSALTRLENHLVDANEKELPHTRSAFSRDGDILRANEAKALVIFVRIVVRAFSFACDFEFKSLRFLLLLLSWLPRVNAFITSMRLKRRIFSFKHNTGRVNRRNASSRRLRGRNRRRKDARRKLPSSSRKSRRRRR